jgi:cardiolipin synthase A/B
VAEIERAFGRVWTLIGDPLPDSDPASASEPRGEVSLRIVATEPATTGMLRLDQLVAALARKRLWLSDAYFAGTTSYVQALRAAAQDGVDVRLLVPGASDIPMLQPLSRAGYRTLLEAGVRVFEWNGTMMHAKTAVADGHWARIGSTNLNIASWLGNCELDAVIEDEAFAARMEETFERDLTNATEVVLDRGRKVRSSVPARATRGLVARGSGSAKRATAGAVRLGPSARPSRIDANWGQSKRDSRQAPAWRSASLRSSSRLFQRFWPIRLWRSPSGEASHCSGMAPACVGTRSRACP